MDIEENKITDKKNILSVKERKNAYMREYMKVYKNNEKYKNSVKKAVSKYNNKETVKIRKHDAYIKNKEEEELSKELLKNENNELKNKILQLEKTIKENLKV